MDIIELTSSIMREMVFHSHNTSPSWIPFILSDSEKGTVQRTSGNYAGLVYVKKEVIFVFILIAFNVGEFHSNF